MSPGTCALCRKDSVLRMSHIVPRFASKWLKKTSATGYLRGLKEPSKRAQDLPKLPLLCENCEQLLAKLESYFAREIYYPILDEKHEEISYDSTFRRFIISLNWRTLITGYESQLALHPWAKRYLDKAQESWRKYLLCESSNSGPYKHHMFFTKLVDDDEIEIPESFQFYALRAIDSTLASGSKDIIAYTHFPHVFFVSTIFPPRLTAWKDTEIKNRGKFTTKSQINDYRLWEFLLSRSKTVSTLTHVPTDKRILTSLARKSERALKSETLAVFIEESKRERRRRIRKMPIGIQGLIDIVDRSADHPEFDSLKQGWANLTQHMVANALSHIPLDKAILIDSLIRSTIVLADRKHKCTQCDFETSELIARFIVTICDTRDKQLALLDNALSALIKKRKHGDERIIVVFSLNPLDKEMPYQTAYYTG